MNEQQSSVERVNAARLWPACDDSSDTTSPDGLYVDADLALELARELDDALERIQALEAIVNGRTGRRGDPQ
jgi:hypothetical protein